MQPKIKKGDTVFVQCGKDKGKKSKVIKVFPKKSSAIVEKVSVAKKHQKPTRDFPGGIIDKLMPVSFAKLLVVCPHCNKPSRMAKKDGFRACKKCGEIIDKGK